MLGYTVHRVLFVLAHPMGDEAALQKTLQRYQEHMRRTAAWGLAPEEYYLLVVTPRIPAYLQCTPEIQAYARRCTEEDMKHLKRFGAHLGIPTERQYIAEGNANWEALRLSKALSIDEVQGHTTGFLRFLAFREALRLRWQRHRSFKPSAFHALRHAWWPKATPTHTATCSTTEAISSLETSTMRKRDGEEKMTPTHQKIGFLLDASRDKLATVESNQPPSLTETAKSIGR